MEKPFREKHSFFIVLFLFMTFGLYIFLSKEIFGIPLFAYLVLLGIDVIWVNLLSINRAIKAKKWPSISGVLISAEAIEMNYASASSDWLLEVQYKYSVSGISYVGDNYNWVGRVSSSKNKIEDLVSKIKCSKPFYIKFNPINHSDSVILSEVSLLYLAGVIGGATITGLGVIGILDYFNFLSVNNYIRS